MNGGSSEADRLRSLREVLTATGAGTYLATHLAGPLPAETVAAVHESDELELRLGRTGPDRGIDLEQREQEARSVVAAVMGADPDRLVLDHGAAGSAGAVALEVLAQDRAKGAPLGEAQAIVLPGTPKPVAAAVAAVAAAAGVRLERLERFPRRLPPDVVLVVMAHVDADGRAADVAAVGQSARRAGARLIVDASLSLGALPFDLGWGADAVVADAHRWLLGPQGVSVAWLSAELGDAAPARLRTAAGPFGRGALLGLARSVGWLLMYVELPWLLDRTERLSWRLREGLAAIDGVSLVEGSGVGSALLAFAIEGWDAEMAAEELSRSVFAILEVDEELDRLRVSVGAWNREDELDRFVARVGELAVHTPETLPRRPSLTVLNGRRDEERG